MSRFRRQDCAQKSEMWVSHHWFFQALTFQGQLGLGALDLSASGPSTSWSRASWTTRVLLLPPPPPPAPSRIQQARAQSRSTGGRVNLPARVPLGSRPGGPSYLPVPKRSAAAATVAATRATRAAAAAAPGGRAPGSRERA